MITVRTYNHLRFDEWNQFVAEAKNATFLLDRRYMDYHQERFHDASMLFYDKKGLLAVLPAHKEGDCLYSHRGLTYGGLILSRRVTAVQVCEIFQELNARLRDIYHFSRVEYKVVPTIYHQLPSDEALYALTKVCHAVIKSRDVASVVVLNQRLPLSTLRRRGVRKAQKVGAKVVEMGDFAPFWKVLETNLLTRYQASPVHSLQEIELLRSRFPEQIRLFVTCCGTEILGGTVLYIDRGVVKTQYISASEQGRKLGALDFLFDTLLDKFAQEGMRYFDFGTSNMKASDDLHESLIFQKEGFGGRAVCYDTYEWKL